MANRDGAGSGTFPAFRFTAAAATAQYAVVPVSPVSGNRVPSTAVALVVDLSNTAGGNSDVRVEVSTDSAFASTAWSSTLTDKPNGLLQVVASGLVSGTKYFWRARLAPTGTTTWGPWSGTARAVSSYTLLTVSATAAASALDAPANAVDGNAGTWWHSYGEIPTWWRAEFATAQVVRMMSVQNRPGFPNRTQKDFLIQGSNDGSAWTTLYTGAGVSWSASDEKKVFEFSNSTAYKYVRIYITATNGDVYSNIAEVTFGKDPASSVVLDPWAFTPDLNSGRGFAFVELNAGVDLPLDRDVTAAAYVDLNAGFQITRDPDAVEYGHAGDVNTLPPAPHVWFLKPNAGREGDGVAIYCFGVGDLQATWSGSVQLYYGAAIGWVTVPVVSWQTFPPTSNAYTAARLLDPSLPHIDMQHSVIEIVVPAGAVPPGYPVRVRTVTP